MTLSLALFLLLVAVNGLDIYTTLRIVKGGGQEGNPILAPLVKRMGVIPALLVVKIPILALAWLFCSPYPLILLGLNVAFIGVCVWNFEIIRKNNL